MSPPLVAVSVSIDPGRRWRPGHDYLYVHRAYGRSLAAAGAAPVLWTPETPLPALDHFAAVVVTGGDDVPTRLYGQERHPGLTPESRARVLSDLKLLAACRRRRVPVLGICYGMQLLAVLQDGDLIQHLPGPPESATDHGRADAPHDHDVEVFEGSRLARWIGPGSHRVRSAHHQAVSRPGRSMAVAARSPDGIVEAIETRGAWEATGVEWHPEHDATGPGIYQGFVDDARARAPRVRNCPSSGRPAGTG